MDKLDFLDSPEGEPAITPAIEPVSEAPPEPTEGPARGPDGKFVKAEAPEPTIAPETPPEPVAPVAQEPSAAQIPPGYVPVSALQELRQEIRQLKQAPPPPIPDRFDDPEGFEAHREQQLHQTLLNDRLNFSERFARKEHGADTVDKARDWALAKFDADPLYSQRILSNADPYEAVVQDWKREQVLSSMKDGDLDAFLAWKNGQAPSQAPAAPAAVVAPAPQPSPPPRSLAAAPNAGGAKPGAQPVGPGVAFDTVFKD